MIRRPTPAFSLTQRDIIPLFQPAEFAVSDQRPGGATAAMSSPDGMATFKHEKSFRGRRGLVEYFKTR
jgi:hypothetical protein